MPTSVRDRGELIATITLNPRSLLQLRRDPDVDGTISGVQCPGPIVFTAIPDLVALTAIVRMLNPDRLREPNFPTGLKGQHELLLHWLRMGREWHVVLYRYNAGSSTAGRHFRLLSNGGQNSQDHLTFRDLLKALEEQSQIAHLPMIMPSTTPEGELITA